MCTTTKKRWIATVVATLPLAAPGLAYDVTDELALEALFSAVYQYADFDEGVELSNTGRATAVLDLGISFQPTDRDKFAIVLSFATGNALNDINPFTLAPYADDLEDDLENINGAAAITCWKPGTSTSFPSPRTAILG